MIYWREQARSFECPTCKAEAGKPCITISGKAAKYAHAARGQTADRCPSCGIKLLADALPGDVCERCQYVRELELERARKWVRRY